jgi:hypothetical protein
MLANISNYSDRIEAGKRVEHSILNGLRQKGIKIEDPTVQQDKYDKIDGWWVDTKGKKYPVQVKFRQSGDDILFELIKDIDRDIPGRDIISKAILYLVADRSGTTRLFHTQPIKDKAQQVLKMIEKEMETDPQKTEWSGPGWQAKLQVDRAHGQRKVIAYFRPTSFNALATWNLNIYEAVLREMFIDTVLG